jgi:sulfate permease, SulP family
MGGCTAALIAIPASIGYGLLALAPLGESVVPHAVLAGLFAPIFGCVVAVLLGANTTMIYSPRSVATFLIGSFVLHDLARSTLPLAANSAPVVLLALAFMLCFLTGVFQVLFGLLKFGNLVKYIPAPVIAGFQNAAAFLLFASQLDMMLGLPTHTPYTAVLFHLDEAKPLTIAVGILTCALIMRGAGITRKIPPTILGLIGGIATYHVLAKLGFEQQLGLVLGKIETGLPDFQYVAEFLGLLADPRFLQFLPVLVAGAASVAIVASLDALLCARLIEADSGNKFEGNRELVRLGAGNMVSASMGGIANGINLASSFANHRAGGRTYISLLVLAVAILFSTQLFAPVIALIPRVVISAALVVVAIQLVDRWTLQILKKLARREVPLLSGATLDLCVILMVATVAIAMNLVFAVLLGTAVTILFFLFRMSKSVIRRVYRCDAVHSRKTREPKLMAILARHGRRILVVEVEGPIFFGTAENLALHLEAEWRSDVAYMILDIKRVNEIDSTGAKVILQMHDKLTREGRHLLLSSLPEGTALTAFLRDMGVTAAITRGRIFPDADRAIEWAEDHLILTQLGDVESGAEFPFGQLDVLAGMDNAELAAVRETLERRTYRKGDVVFREGETSNELYIIAKGAASVRLRLAGTERETRLITFAPGTMFGELALLDQEARSATVEADEELVCYVLTRARFDSLTARQPEVAIKLLTNLGRELSGRLRRANRTIYQLAV